MSPAKCSVSVLTDLVLVAPEANVSLRLVVLVAVCGRRHRQLRILVHIPGELVELRSDFFLDYPRTVVADDGDDVRVCGLCPLDQLCVDVGRFLDRFIDSGLGVAVRVGDDWPGRKQRC